MYVFEILSDGMEGDEGHFGFRVLSMGDVDMWDLDVDCVNVDCSSANMGPHLLRHLVYCIYKMALGMSNQLVEISKRVAFYFRIA